MHLGVPLMQGYRVINQIIVGDALELLKTLPDATVQMCVTSPPYYGVEGQYGLEKTPSEYVDNMVNVFREVRRVLKDDGTLWLNLGSRYASKVIKDDSLCITG